MAIPSSFVIRASSFANALEQMPELRLFCLEIFFVVRIGFGPDRHLLDHFQTVALEPDNFFRVICEEPELSHTQIEKNLCAEPVIAQVSCVSEIRVGLYGVESFLLQLVSVDFCRQPDTAALLSHINQNALAFLVELPQRGVPLIPGIAPARRENCASETLAVHAHQRRFVLVDPTFHERKMVMPIELGAIQMQIEIAVVGGHFYDLL